MPSSQLVT